MQAGFPGCLLSAPWDTFLYTQGSAKARDRVIWNESHSSDDGGSEENRCV